MKQPVFSMLACSLLLGVCSLSFAPRSLAQNYYYYYSALSANYNTVARQPSIVAGTPDITMPSSGRILCTGVVTINTSNSGIAKIWFQDQYGNAWGYRQLSLPSEQGSATITALSPFYDQGTDVDVSLMVETSDATTLEAYDYFTSRNSVSYLEALTMVTND